LVFLDEKQVGLHFLYILYLEKIAIPSFAVEKMWESGESLLVKYKFFMPFSIATACAAVG
jgi:uncharacterized membrane protein